jgi:hypothetical protein
MPRKQRFKPSRKPKPIPTTQAEGMEASQSTQKHDGAQAPDGTHAETAAEVRIPQYQELSDSR